MTVEELREKLQQFEGNQKLAVYWEQEKDHMLFEIGELSIATGELVRSKDGTIRITFDHRGPVSLLLIGVEPMQ